MALDRILYTSLIDVSLPNGPGVNERVFLRDMADRFGGTFCAVIPEPSRGLPDSLRTLNAVTIDVGRSPRRRLGWLKLRLAGTLVLRRTIRRFRPDLLVMRVGMFSLPHYLVARDDSVPYVLKTAGDVTFRRFVQIHSPGPILLGMNELMARRVWLGAAAIDLVTEQKRRELLEVYPVLESRVHVIDNGVDLEDFRPRRSVNARAELGFAPEDIVLGYVGNFPMSRGGKEVVDLVAALRESAPVKGLIVGDTGQAEALRKYARNRGVSEAVLVYGQADYAKVPDLMTCMNVGLSILRPRERMASEQKVRQYLASGLPVVGTAGSNDFLKNKPFARVVGSEATGEVVEAVGSLIRQGPAELLRLGRQAREYAEAFLSIRQKNDERLRIWEEAVRGSGTGAN